MTLDVVIVDYGIGNLCSVRRALEHCGAHAIITDDPNIIMDAPRLVLPGVGAFEVGMRGLIERGLDFVLREFAQSGKPLLGICLGMQMLTNESEEFGLHTGLCLIPGRVVPIPRTTVEEKKHKIPHIGWAELLKPKHINGWDDSILAATTPGDSVYLVHSYSVETDEEYQLASYEYNSRVISAAIRKGNIYGTQFHPEKSAVVGLKILKQFLLISESI